MIGIDTNILIRYIVRDDENQAKAADKIMGSCSENMPALINQIVLVEMVWVLKRFYKYSKLDILKILELILFNSDIEVLNSEEAKKAFIEYEKGNADFSDYFIAAINSHNGVLFTFTFDKQAAQCNGFKLVE